VLAAVLRWGDFYARMARKWKCFFQFTPKWGRLQLVGTDFWAVENNFFLVARLCATFWGGWVMGGERNKASVLD